MDAGPVVMHTYAGFGSFTVTLIVTDDDGAVSADSFDVTVLNVAPVVIPSDGQSGLEGQVISLENVHFSDAGTLDTHSGTVDWGDGSPVESGTVRSRTSK